MAPLPVLSELMLLATVILLGGYVPLLAATCIATLLRRLAQSCGVPNPPRFNLSDFDIRLIHTLTTFTIIVTYLIWKVDFLVTTLKLAFA